MASVETQVTRTVNMAALAFHALLAALLCSHAFAFTELEKMEMAGQVQAIERNAKFQKNLATVATSTQVYGAQEEELSKAAEAEQKECIREAARGAMAEGAQLVDQTVGKIIPELEAVSRIIGSEAPTDQEWNTVSDFLKAVDYPTYKKTAMKSLKEKLVSWVPEKQSAMAKCLA